MRHTTAAIQATVADFYGLHVKHMTSPSMERHIARPRQVAMYLARQLLPSECNTLPCIARRFGKKDHTTILYGVRAVERRMITDEALERDVMTLKRKLVA